MDIKTRILMETGELFGQNGIKNVTMDYIASRMGISKRTIYENFKDKDALVKQVIEEGAKIHKASCLELIEKSENVFEAIFNIGKHNHQTFGKIHPLFFEDLKKYHFNIYSDVIEKGDFRDTGITYILLERGKKEGLFNDNINIDAVNMFLHEIFRMVHKEEFLKFGREVLYESVFLPYWMGISTAKGRKIIEKNMENIKKSI